MAYAFKQAADPAAIAPNAYGVAAAIGFTAFTSCIGIAGRVGGTDTVVGLHLLMTDGGQPGVKFAAGDVPTVIGQLNALGMQAGTAIVIGSISDWSNPANGVSAAYAALVNALQPRDVYPLGDGTYGAELAANGDVMPTF